MNSKSLGDSVTTYTSTIIWISIELQQKFLSQDFPVNTKNKTIMQISNPEDTKRKSMKDQDIS